MPNILANASFYGVPATDGRVPTAAEVRALEGQHTVSGLGDNEICGRCGKRQSISLSNSGFGAYANLFNPFVQGPQSDWCDLVCYGMIDQQAWFEMNRARYIIRTDGGHLIYVSNIGIRHASPKVMSRLNAGEEVDQSLIYFRAIPKFETEVPGLDWLMKHVLYQPGNATRMAW